MIEIFMLVDKFKMDRNDIFEQNDVYKKYTKNMNIFNLLYSKWNEGIELVPNNSSLPKENDQSMQISIGYQK